MGGGLHNSQRGVTPEPHLEVDVAVLVHVERPEHVITELLGVARGEEHLVHVDKLHGGELAIRTVLLKTET